MKINAEDTVSLVVPAYNVEDYIKGCVESIVSQSHSALEVLVVNDASVDRTSDVVAELCEHDSRVRLIDLERNVGVHAARAKGIREARGRYVGFVDSDDTVSPHMVRRLLEAALTHDADIVVCGAEKVAESGEALGRKVKFERPFISRRDILKDFCHRRYGSGVLWNKLYKANLIKKHGTIHLDRKVDASEDYVVNVGCFAEATCVAALADTLYFYLIRAGSASRDEDKARHFVRIMAAYASCLEVYADFSPQQKEEVTKLFASQLCFSDYQIDAVEQLYRHEDNLRESLAALATLYPAGIYTLIHAFFQSGKAGSSDIVRYAGHVHKAIKKWF